jgi:hypothetical protein
MEEFEKIAGESRTSAPNAPKRESYSSPTPGRASSSTEGSGLVNGSGARLGADDDASVWNELKSRREKASRRISEGWERVSDNAKGYADEHSIGVALGSLGVGVALGILIGAVVARD